MTSVWQILKSFLFCNILIVQSIIRTVAFESIPQSLAIAAKTNPQALSSAIISSFFHLSFVTSRFGGGLTSQGGGFSEQKRVFYSALDITSSHVHETELLVERLAARLSGLSANTIVRVAIEEYTLRARSGTGSPSTGSTHIILLGLL